MPVTLNLVNFDDLYRRVTTDKFLINHIDVFDHETKEIIDAIITKNYNEDNISIVPSCQCGEVKGTYYVGETCHRCNTKVASTLDDNLSFLLWLKQPEGVERFISPKVMAMLLDRYKVTANINMLEWLLLPSINIDYSKAKAKKVKLDKIMFNLKANGVQRGYNYFVENFFHVVQVLEDSFVVGKNTTSVEFMDFLRANADKIFSEYLPFPNKVIFATESNELGKFMDKSLIGPINVIRRMTGIDLHTRTPAVKQARVAASIIDLAKFYIAYFKTVLFHKNGLIRQHVSSTRAHFTARAVITSLTTIHAYDEIHIPWSVACTLLREHILNRLYKRNYSYKQAINFLMYHNRIYHPVLDEIFKEIVGSVEGGLVCLFNRNPSLHRGSIQRVRITRVKTDTDDNTFSFSYLIGASFNSDYDGF